MSARSLTDEIERNEIRDSWPSRFCIRSRGEGRPSITLSPLPLGRGCEVLRKSDIDDGEKRATGSWGLEAAAAVRSRARHEAASTKPGSVTTLSRGSG